MARKTKLTDELSKKICAFIASGATNEDACKLTGIGESSFYDWIKRFPEFSEAVKKASVDFKRAHILKIAMDESWQSSAWLLERRFPEEYGKRIPLELTGKDGGPVEVDEKVHFYMPHNGRD